MTSVTRAFGQILFSILLFLPVAALADTLRIAVASNFTEPMKALEQQFEQQTGYRLLVSYGSTGKLYAQIKHGAPFDILLAADEERPRRLVAQGDALEGSRFTYAEGQLVLWSRDPEVVDGQGQVLQRLKQDKLARLAIANPKLAPYGRAAQQVLEQLGVWQELKPRLVRGENIAQTHQFVITGNVSLGLVALSQVQRPGKRHEGSMWQIPTTFYQPIKQQAVQLSDKPSAAEFLTFLRGANARQSIEKYGYGLP